MAGRPRRERPRLGGDEDPRNLGADAFAGTAEAYLRDRPPEAGLRAALAPQPGALFRETLKAGSMLARKPG